MKLTELAQAIEDGKTIQIMDHGWRDMDRTSALKNAFSICDTNCSTSIRIKPEVTPIDLSVLIQSGIDCEFSSFAPAIGATIGILESINAIDQRLYVGNVDGSGGNKDYNLCRPRMYHWHSWQGGKCPLPEGLRVEVKFRSGEKRRIFVGEHKWFHDNTCSSNEIIAFRVLGKADTHCWPWECDR